MALRTMLGPLTLCVGVALDSLGAQVGSVRIAGTIVDTAGRAIDGALVQIIDTHNQLRGRARSDSIGRYNIIMASADSIRVLVNHIGFVPSESAVMFVSEAQAVEYDAVLAHVTPILDPVIVRAATNEQAFLARMATGGRHAHFLDSTALAPKDKRSLMWLFGQLDGTHLRVRSVGPAPGRIGTGEVLLGVNGCPATVYVDGWKVPGGQIMWSVDAREIAGIEVYDDPAFAPYPYNIMDSYHSPPDCPVMLVWSKAGFAWPPRSARK